MSSKRPGRAALTLAAAILAAAGAALPASAQNAAVASRGAAGVAGNPAGAVPVVPAASLLRTGALSPGMGLDASLPASFQALPHASAFPSLRAPAGLRLDAEAALGALPDTFGPGAALPAPGRAAAGPSAGQSALALGEAASRASAQDEPLRAHGGINRAWENGSNKPYTAQNGGAAVRGSWSSLRSRLSRPAGAVAVAAGAAALLIPAPALAAEASRAAQLTGGDMIAAVVAGLFAFISPCVLPLIPGYISFISGLSRQELLEQADRRTVMIKAGLGSIFFVAGFTVAFTVLGATATALGAFVVDYLPYFTKAAGALVVLFGLHTTGLLRIPFLYREARFHGKIKPGFIGAFLMGLAFALGWTPCIGPVLSGILALAARHETVWAGIKLLGLFSLGLGLPFVATGFSINAFLHFFNRYKRFIEWGERAAGAFLILLGVLILTDNMGFLLKWIPEFFYRFAK